jgi:hypothetical protein
MGKELEQEGDTQCHPDLPVHPALSSPEPCSRSYSFSQVRSHSLTFQGGLKGPRHRRAMCLYLDPHIGGWVARPAVQVAAETKFEIR